MSERCGLGASPGAPEDYHTEEDAKGAIELARRYSTG